MQTPGLKPPIPVDETDVIELDEFQAAYVEQHRPLIIRGAISHWRTMDWSDRYLDSRVGNHALQVDVTSPRDDGSTRGEPQLRSMTISEFIARYRDRDTNHYILDQNLCPALHEDLGQHQVSRAFPVSRRKTMFWGHGEQSSNLHYDDNENLMCMCDGEKEFLLFDVGDFSRMYPSSYEEYRSAIDPAHHSPEDHPAFAEATPYIAHIRKGDVLYVPCYWWHHVRSNDRHLAVSYIIHEQLEQRLRVVRKLLGDPSLAIAPAIRAELQTIASSDERPALQRKRLRAHHARHRESSGRTYYPHSIFARLIDENLMQVLYGHRTY